VKKAVSARSLLIISMAVFGTLGLFVRNIALTSEALALCRAILATALIGLYLLISRQKLPLGVLGKTLPLLLISGAALALT